MNQLSPKDTKAAHINKPRQSIITRFATAAPTAAAAAARRTVTTFASETDITQVCVDFPKQWWRRWRWYGDDE